MLLIKNNNHFILIQILARCFVLLNYILPAIMVIFLLNGSTTTNILNSCMGNFELNFIRQGQIHILRCDYAESTLLTQITCYGALGSYFVFSNNILEAILLYQCFKKINNHTEEVKSLIGEKTYIRRRKYVQLKSDETAQLLNKPYVNEVTLRGQK